MAQMAPNGCEVYFIDHIQEITDFAINNIKKDNSNLFHLKKMIPVTMDGRKGLPGVGQFDVIHVGGAIERVPQELEE
jgi:protein-L-isoaspartate O-methyltransferase